MQSLQVTICLCLFALMINAERVVIEDYNGPEEQEIVDQATKLLKTITGGDVYSKFGPAHTRKIVYTNEANFAEYETEFYLEGPNGQMPFDPPRLLIKAEQNGNEPTVIKEIKQRPYIGRA